MTLGNLLLSNTEWRQVLYRTYFTLIKYGTHAGAKKQKTKNKKRVLIGLCLSFFIFFLLLLLLPLLFLLSLLSLLLLLPLLFFLISSIS